MVGIGRAGRVLVVVGAMTLVLGACDWPMFHNGPTQDGYNSTETIVGPGNVAQLTQRWRGNTGNELFDRSPVLARGRLYIGEQGNRLDAFLATGNMSTCAGTPKACPRLWSYSPGGSQVTNGSPAVIENVVYGSWDGGKLYAFDARGNTNCAGTPKTCGPLWRTTQMGNTAPSSPQVANGVVYVNVFDTGTLNAFDAAGITNCSGVPKVCSPLWTAATGANVSGSPAIANGVAYVTSQDGSLYAFDAAGATNCSGLPKTCTPLWTAPTGHVLDAPPAVSGGIVYVAGGGERVVYAFDATGSTDCSGVPKTCTPLWTAPTNGNTYATPAIAYGTVYIGSYGGVGGNVLSAFDAQGITNCAGAPKVCSPLWTGPTGGIDVSSPAVANGLVFAGSIDNKLYAFDAHGISHCSGSPTTCSPLWTAMTGDLIESSPAVANGWVYVGSNDHYVHAYSPPVP